MTLATVFACALLGAPSAGASTFVDPEIRQDGPVFLQFDHSAQNCEQVDIPDAPARAWRDTFGQVNLIASHAVTRRAIGPSLDNVQHQCAVVFTSTDSPDPSVFADYEWISSPYRLDDDRVVSLVHNEYQGSRHPGMCSTTNYFSCWFNSITLAMSTNRGATFQRVASPPGHLVASIPYRYQADTGPAGIMLPSNIVRRGDGYYYAMVATQEYGAQQRGVCVMRTDNLTDQNSWRAWDGSSYSVRFINPYLDSSPPEEHVCAPVSFHQIGMMSSSLTFSTYLNKWVLAGAYDFQDEDGVKQPGFYWSTSSDLITWTKAKRFISGEVLWSHQCGDEDPILYPSLLDPASPSPNFETIGKRPYLYFTQFNYGYNSGGCWMSLNRDLARIPLEFNKPPDCGTLVAKPDYLPSMNRSFFPITLSGATEPDGEAMSLKIDSVTQNQPVKGPGDSTSPDAMRITTPNTVLLRAEYSAGQGRVYRINVTVRDSKNAPCSTTVNVKIPRTAADTSPSYSSFTR